jgi:hypothetical protein
VTVSLSSASSTRRVGDRQARFEHIARSADNKE